MGMGINFASDMTRMEMKLVPRYVSFILERREHCFCTYLREISNEVGIWWGGYETGVGIQTGDMVGMVSIVPIKPGLYLYIFFIMDGESVNEL